MLEDWIRPKELARRRCAVRMWGQRVWEVESEGWIWVVVMVVSAMFVMSWAEVAGKFCRAACTGFVGLCVWRSG